EEEAYERTRAHLLARSRSGSDFFPLAFHVPVSVVIGDVNDERVLTGVQVLGADGYSEAGIVREFWERIERFRGTLVTFNGRNFDLPVMELAALRHGCVMPRYFKGGFRYRYSDEAHYDLYEFVTNFGAYSVRGGFHLLAQLVGLPGKDEVDGAGVQALWEGGRLADIHAYCRRGAAANSRRSASSSVGTSLRSRAGASGDGSPRTAAGRSSSVIVSAAASANARSIVFWSSRTLPGQA